MNVRRIACGRCGERLLNLDDPDRGPMCGDCRVVGPDGRPLGGDDGVPTEYGGGDLYLCPVCDAVIETPLGGDPECPGGPHDRNWCAVCKLEVFGDPDRARDGAVICSEYCRGRQDERACAPFVGGIAQWNWERRSICAATTHCGNYVAICDLPRGHVDDVHQESSGITWQPDGTVL